MSRIEDYSSKFNTIVQSDASLRRWFTTLPPARKELLRAELIEAQWNFEVIEDAASSLRRVMLDFDEALERTDEALAAAVHRWAGRGYVLSADGGQILTSWSGVRELKHRNEFGPHGPELPRAPARIAIDMDSVTIVTGNSDEIRVRNALGKLGYEIRRCSRSERLELRTGESAWSPIDEPMLHALYAKLEAGFATATDSGRLHRIKVGRSAAARYGVLDAIVHSSDLIIDSFDTDFLQLTGAWDRENRFASALVEAGFEPDCEPELAEWFLRAVLLGAVYRTYQPGYKHDETPIFVGPQGCGKSSFVSLLLPPDSRWAVEQMVIPSTPSEEGRAIEAMQGAVIVEAAELVGLGRVALNRTKSFMTRRVDKYRGAYKREAIEYPRRCVIIATGNDDLELPDDPTGGRRWVPIRVSKGGGYNTVRRYMEKNRLQLWAQALHEHDKGLIPRIPETLEPVRDEAYRRYRSVDETAESIAASMFAAVRHPIRIRDFAELWGALTDTVIGSNVSELTRIDRIIAKHLTREGWTRRVARIQGHRAGQPGRYWFPPEYDGASPPLEETTLTYAQYAQVMKHQGASQ